MEFIKLLRGHSSLSEWAFASILVLLGFVLLKLLQYENRREKSTKFKFSYWWVDNRIEFLSGLIIFYVLFRFYYELKPYLLQTPIPQNFIESKFLIVFVLGLILQLVLKRLRKVLKFRHKEYPSGTSRPEYVS